MEQKSLQSRESLLKKYSYEIYDPVYPLLYREERQRLAGFLSGLSYHIYHFGSTAIPGVGGKGIIDIFISTAPDKIKAVTAKLTEAGYEYRESGSNRDRLFFQNEIQGRRYHIHVTGSGNKTLLEVLAFRDYLREHPLLADAYSRIKIQASREAQQMATKAEMKARYHQVKKPVIDKIASELPAYIKLHRERYTRNAS